MTDTNEDTYESPNTTSSDGLFDSILYGNMIGEDICIPRGFFIIIITIIFPPLGVFINQYYQGFPNPTSIGISMVLTALFYFPGLIYALNQSNCRSVSNKGYRAKSRNDAKADRSV